MSMVKGISRFERRSLLVLSGIFGVLFIVSLITEIDLNFRAQELNSRFPRLVLHHYRVPLAGLHALSVVLFLSVVFARRYIAAISIALIYSGLVTVGIASRLDGAGVYGGEGFYADRQWLELMVKTHEFDLVSSIFLPVISLWLASIVFRSFRRDKSAVLP
jgi:hypothetical protein